jgi:hypothetical protein
MLLFSAVAAAIFVAGAVFFAVQHDDYAKQQTEAKASAAARLAATEASLAIEQSAKLLAGFAMHSGRSLLEARDCGPQLREMQRLNPAYLHLAVANPAGEIICSTAKTRDPSVTLAADGVFKRVMQSEHGEASGLVRCPVTGKRGVVLQHPVVEEGAVIGVLAASTDLAAVGRVVRAAGLPSGASMSVVDRDGVIFAAFPDEDRLGKVASLDGQAGVVAYARIKGLASDDSAFARVVLPEANPGPGLWLLLLAVPLVFGALWAAGNVWVVGRVASLLGRENAGKLVGRYRGGPGQQDYTYEVAWTDSATGVQWEGKVRVDGELVGLPSGELVPTPGLDVPRVLRREIESAIEHRLAQD